MATKFNSTAAFMAKLLMPLPADEEPVDSVTFLKLIERDGKIAWAKAMEQVELAECRHRMEAIRCRNSGGCQLATFDAYKARVDAEAAQCLVPAPTDKELRWKQRRFRVMSNRPEVAAAIAADKARLGGRS